MLRKPHSLALLSAMLSGCSNTDSGVAADGTIAPLVGSWAMVSTEYRRLDSTRIEVARSGGGRIERMIKDSLGTVFRSYEIGEWVVWNDSLRFSTDTSWSIYENDTLRASVTSQYAVPQAYEVEPNRLRFLYDSKSGGIDTLEFLRVVARTR